MKRSIYDGIDFVKRGDSDIARELGVSREAVRQARVRLHMPAASTLFKNKQLDNLTDAEWKSYNNKMLSEMYGMAPSTVSEYRVRNNKPKCTVRRYSYPPKISDSMNWELPSEVLAAIWGNQYHYVTMVRYRENRGKSKWDLRKDKSRLRDDPTFIKMFNEEIETAKKVLKNKKPEQLEELHTLSIEHIL